jgi:hypothetical protein
LGDWFKTREEAQAEADRMNAEVNPNFCTEHICVVPAEHSLWGECNCDFCQGAF